MNKCMCRVHTSSMEKSGCVVWESEVRHNHVVEAAEVKALKVKAKIRSAAVKSIDNPCNIIDNNVHNIAPSTAYVLPHTKSLCRMVQRLRQHILQAPALPANAISLEIPEMFRSTKKGDPFLLDNFVDETIRILTFTTTANLKVLKKCRTWQCDGTFDVVPSVFEQLYTIHGRYKDALVPLVYVLSTSRTQAVYEHVLHTLVGDCDKLKPRRMISDFEMAYLNAFAAVFPDSDIHGCFFHFAQSI